MGKSKGRAHACERHGSAIGFDTETHVIAKRRHKQVVETANTETTRRTLTPLVRSRQLPKHRTGNIARLQTPHAVANGDTTKSPESVKHTGDGGEVGHRQRLLPRQRAVGLVERDQGSPRLRQHVHVAVDQRRRRVSLRSLGDPHLRAVGTKALTHNQTTAALAFKDSEETSTT